MAHWHASLVVCLLCVSYWTWAAADGPHGTHTSTAHRDRQQALLTHLDGRFEIILVSGLSWRAEPPSAAQVDELEVEVRAHERTLFGSP